MTNTHFVAHEIEARVAIPFIERWHYSGLAPKGGNRYFGCYAADRLYAVADYGVGVNPYQASGLSKLLGRTVHPFELVELKRLCRVEPRDDGLPLTRFLSWCHRELRRSGIRWVVSFSDPAHGHAGGIYRAASFTYLGQTKAEWHTVDSGGTVRHRRVYYRHARRHGLTMEEARKQLGLTPVKTMPKDRWVKEIG